ncbi:unnamed protein product [Thlaspi arvense]|uniref:Uncharacterized protein n=1 Tax=Thlaspi arvense TaxID=13288 RepID=A0AAU9R892_THLAR|nr:unnamed protein product [Thlaspi arvense]
MASDASSGPSNHLPKKHAAKKNGSKQVSLEKRQHREKAISNEGEKSELKAKTRTSSASRVQSKGKVVAHCFLFVDAVPNNLSARFSVGILLYYMYPVLH